MSAAPLPFQAGSCHPRGLWVSALALQVLLKLLSVFSIVDLLWLGIVFETFVKSNYFKLLSLKK